MIPWWLYLALMAVATAIGAYRRRNWSPEKRAAVDRTNQRARAKAYSRTLPVVGVFFLIFPWFYLSWVTPIVVAAGAFMLWMGIRQWRALRRSPE